MRCRAPIIVSSLIAIAAAGMLAGCGGGNSPGIASVAGDTTPATTTAQSAPPSGGNRPSGGPGGGQFQLAMKVDNAADGAKFSACMRKHGITNFPDPNSQGLISIHSGMGIDPGSPRYQSAQSACSKLLPNGGKPTPAQQAQRQQQMLAYSACMRAHGIKDFPDPTNGGIQLHSGPGSDLDPNNPTFQKAQRACQGNLPFKAAAGATTKSGGGGG